MTDYLYGRNPVLESLRAQRRKAVHLYLLRGVKKQGTIDEIQALVSKQRISYSTVSESEARSLVKHDHHQGVILQTEPYPYVDLSTRVAQLQKEGTDLFFLILDLLQDPQNVGSLLRTAEIVGVNGVIIADKKSVGITPSVVNASSGAVEHLAISQVNNISNAVKQLQENGAWVYGLEGEGNDTTPYHEVDLTGSVGIIVGSEGFGIRELVKKNCDGLLSIPMKGKVASLNASIAGSIVLYKVFEQKKFQ